MYAIVDIAGKQYRVKENDRLFVPRLQDDVGAQVSLQRVLLLADGDQISIGRPVVEGCSVTATVLDHVKGDKVIVFKKKRRKGYRVKRGHRQPYTQISIDAVSAS